MESSTSFGEWLRRRRKALDLTQDALAEQVGCSVGLIRKIEGDERRPSRQMAELMAEALQIPANERARFIQVARAQLRTERLASIAEVADPLPEVPLTQTEDTPSRSTDPHPPAVQEPPAPRYTLPIPPTPLIGRDNEVREIAHLLANPECRLLTIVGPGGMGKTRLALAVAASQPAAFANGVYFVALAPLSAAEFMVPAIAQALGLTFSGTIEPKTQLLNYLRAKQMLLVLDNLEHLLDGVALLGELLAHAANVTLVATSRERLNLQGEWVFDLQGLPVPPPVAAASAAALPTLAAKASAGQNVNLENYSALTLFVRSAQRAQASFVLSAENRPAVARICRLVDGMPLGIELAAAWVHLLSCQEIALEIERSIDFLAVNRRDVPERHRSLRAVFEHSWRRLTTPEQQALSQLSVCRGGFTRAASQVIANAPLLLLSALVVKSLVRRNDLGRYDLHELTRQYAASRLQEDDAWQQAVHKRHSHYYLTFVAERTAALKSSKQVEALTELDNELDNIHQAWAWAATHVDSELLDQAIEGLGLFSLWRGYYQQGEIAYRLAHETLERSLTNSAQMAGALVKVLTWQALFCRQTGQLERAFALLQQGLTLLEPLNQPATALWRASLLLELGRVLSDQDRIQAMQLMQQSLALYQSAGDQWGSAAAYRELGEITRLLGNLDEAKQLATTSLQTYQILQDAKGIAGALAVLNFVNIDRGELVAAERDVQQRIEIYRQVGDRAGLAEAYEFLGKLFLNFGDFDQCALWSTESLTLFTDLGDRRGMMAELDSIGIAKTAQGEYTQARDYEERSLAVAQEIHNSQGIASAHQTLGWVALGEGEFGEARHHLETSKQIFQELGQLHEMNWAFAALSYVELGQGNRTQAQRLFIDLFQVATAKKLVLPVMIALPAFALLCALQDKKEDALEIYTLATTRYPLLGKAQWTIDIAGKQITELTADLPLAVVHAAQERGRARELWGTVAELLAELETELS